MRWHGRPGRALFVLFATSFTDLENRLCPDDNHLILGFSLPERNRIRIRFDVLLGMLGVAPRILTLPRRPTSQHEGVKREDTQIPAASGGTICVRIKHRNSVYSAGA